MVGKGPASTSGEGGAFKPANRRVRMPDVLPAGFIFLGYQTPQLN